MQLTSIAASKVKARGQARHEGRRHRWRCFVEGPRQNALNNWKASTSTREGGEAFDFKPSLAGAPALRAVFVALFLCV